MRSRILSYFTLAFFFAAGAFACSDEEAAPTPSSETHDLIGGIDAQDFALDAVGTIAEVKADNTQNVFCNATLIAPKLVLTSKVCALRTLTTPSAVDGGAPTVTRQVFADVVKLAFNVGGVATRAVAVESVEVCAPESGGFDNFGCNVAVYRLSAPVTDVTPIPYSSTIVGPERLGTQLSVVGYGDQLENGDLRGTRRLGMVTLQAVEGAPLHKLFPTVEQLFALVKSFTNSDAEAPSPALAAFYDRTLLPTSEVYAGGAPNDAQLCSNDSGAPLLVSQNGALTLVGVAGQPTVTTSAMKCLPWGGAFAVMSPAALDVIASSLAAVNAPDPCGDVTTVGRCDGDIAVRCTLPTEGPRRITRNDCSAVLQHCIASADKITQVACGE